MPSTALPIHVSLSRRQALAWSGGLAVLGAGVYALAPQLDEFTASLGRLGQADPWWLLAAGLLEALSIFGYVSLFRGVFRPGSPRLGWRASYDISLASLGAASKLPLPAGAGSLALVAWALRRAGLSRATVAQRMVTFFVVLYGVYLAALLAGGLGLVTGVVPGSAAAGDLPLIAAAAAGGGLIALVLLGLAPPLPRLGAVRDGVRGAVALVRERRGGLGPAVMWWIFDGLALWAVFVALGDPQPVVVILVGYLLGMAGDLLPMPGGIGGIEGATSAALVLLGVAAAPAAVAVVVWRIFNFWLPTVPGVVSLAGLRRRLSPASPAGR